jgi:hypothetical protein
MFGPKGPPTNSDWPCSGLKALLQIPISAVGGPLGPIPLSLGAAKDTPVASRKYMTNPILQVVSMILTDIVETEMENRSTLNGVVCPAAEDTQ